MLTIPRAALEHIAKLNIELGRDPRRDPFLIQHRDDCIDMFEDGPIRIAAAKLSVKLRRALQEAESKLDTNRERLERYERLLAQAVESADAEDIERLNESIADRKADEDFNQMRIEALKSKIEALTVDPHAMFLPLGTVVRFTDSPNYPDASGLGIDSGKSYPVPGSIGVVTRLNHESEYPIAVSMRRPFNDGYGYEWDPSYERMPTFLVDPDKLEVIEPGLLPNGDACESFGFVPTHHREPSWPGDNRHEEMILHADGYYFRFAEINGNVEALQAYEDIAEMTWLGDVIGTNDDASCGIRP